MSKPRLLPALTWPKYEHAVLAVFTEALRRMAETPQLPQEEVPLNFALYWICREVHFEFLRAKKSIPFVILFDLTNQPESDDSADSRRLKKRPDFACVLTNEQATDPRAAQIRYWLECKRLGNAEAKWVFNENYTERGMLRFMQAEHSYGKGCSSASMIGYMQNMHPDNVLKEVNAHAARRTIPSLVKAAVSWAAKNVTQLDNRLVRDFDTRPIDMRHLWIDLRECAFARTTPKTAALRKAGKKKSIIS